MSFNCKRPQSFSVNFDFSLFEWRVEKTEPAIFDYLFIFWDIGQCYIFVSFEVSTKSRKSFKRTAHFLRTHRHGFAQQLFLQMHTAFKGITLRILWVRAQTLQRILSEDPYFFTGTVTLIHLQRICGIRNILAEMRYFNLFFAWKFWHFDKLRVKNVMQNYQKPIYIEKVNLGRQNITC